MRTRQNKWQLLGKSRFIKGNMSELRKLEKLSRRMKLRFEVMIVQPGLPKARVSVQYSSYLVQQTYFLKRTADAKITVICNE